MLLPLRLRLMAQVLVPMGTLAGGSGLKQYVHKPCLLIPLTWYQQQDKLGNPGSYNKAPTPSAPPSLACPLLIHLGQSYCHLLHVSNGLC